MESSEENNHRVFSNTAPTFLTVYGPWYKSGRISRRFCSKNSPESNKSQRRPAGRDTRSGQLGFQTAQGCSSQRLPSSPTRETTSYVEVFPKYIERSSKFVLHFLCKITTPPKASLREQSEKTQDQQEVLPIWYLYFILKLLGKIGILKMQVTEMPSDLKVKCIKLASGMSVNAAPACASLFLIFDSLVLGMNLKTNFNFSPGCFKQLYLASQDEKHIDTRVCIPVSILVQIPSHFETYGTGTHS